MAHDTYSAGDQIIRVEFGDGKEDGVVGCVFVTARGRRIRVFFAKKDVPAFTEKLMERYRAGLD